MKRLNWLRNFGLTVSVAAATAPAVFMSTSCAVTSCYVDVFDFKTVTKELSTASVKHYSTSFNNLLYGSKSNHNGNYILFTGSNTNEAVRRFFGNPGYDLRERSQWFDDSFFSQSTFCNSLLKAALDTEGWGQEGVQDCGFYLFIDFFNGKFYDKKNHEIFISKEPGLETNDIKPFDKWTDSIISQTKIYNKNKEGWNYEWDDESVTKSDYIRQDEYAIAYREFYKRGLALFPKTDKRKETFSTDDGSNDPKMCVFKNGKLVSIQALPSGAPDSIIKTVSKLIVDNYKVVKDEKK